MNNNEYNRNETGKLSIKAVWAFLIGFFSATNVVYLFVVGQTPIEIPFVYCSVLCALTVLARGKLPIFHLPLELTLFFLAVPLSFVTMMIFVPEARSFWLNGVILVLLGFIVMYSVLLYNEYDKYIVYGVLMGLIANVLMSVYEGYMFYRRGIFYNLKYLFPAEGIYEGATAFRTGLVVNGFFREPGHLMRYMGVMVFVVFSSIKWKRKITPVILGACFFIMALYCRSASFYIAVGALFLGIWAVIRQKNRSKGTVLFLALFFIFVIAGSLQLFSPLFARIQSAFNLGDRSNYSRLLGMLGTIDIIKQYPIFGSGWNTVPTLLSRNGVITDLVSGSFSFGLQTVAQLGIGSLGLFYFLFVRSSKMMLYGNSTKIICYGVAVILFGIECLLTDYAFDASAAVLFGLTINELNRQGTTDLMCGNN